jgi:hypothetical protein
MVATQMSFEISYSQRTDGPQPFSHGKDPSPTDTTIFAYGATRSIA